MVKLDLGTKLVFVGCLGLMIISLYKAFETNFVIGLIVSCITISIVGAGLHMAKD